MPHWLIALLVFGGLTIAVGAALCWAWKHRPDYSGDGSP